MRDNYTTTDKFWLIMAFFDLGFGIDSLILECKYPFEDTKTTVKNEASCYVPNIARETQQ